MAKGKKSGGADGFSLRTKDATDGGGIDGALATIAEIEFIQDFTYGGRFKDKPSSALRTVFEVEGFEKPWEDHWPVGDSKNFEVVADGDGIKKIGGGSLNRKSAGYFFFQHLEAAAEESGIDIEELVPDVEGENCQSVAELRGRRVRLASRPFVNMSGDSKDKAVIAAFVDDEPAPKSKGKSASASKKPAAKASAEDVESETETQIVALLDAAKNNTLKQSDVPNKLYQENRSDPNVKAMMALALKKDWMFDDDRPWDSDVKKGTVSQKDDDE